MTDTQTKPIPTSVDQGDHERFAHYVYTPKGDSRDPEVIITEAMVNGTEVRALCGKLWIPSRDPKKYPICPECKDLAEKFFEVQPL